jgi:hypothetical protein
MTLKKLRKLAFRFGYDFTLRRMPQYEIDRRALDVPRDMEPEFLEIYRRASAFTMTSVERMYALYQAVGHVVRQGIPGDLVECGVWKGGSAMVMALTLQALGDTGRRIWLYDTFAGMTRPGEIDRRARDGAEMVTRWEHFQRDGHNAWTFAPLDEVRTNVESTGYPADKLSYVQGEVEHTIPAQVPESIAVLRLDTDWYQSTYHEMCHLYPLLVRSGLLVLDDYGSFEGARAAVDQYLAEQALPLFLARIDTTGRIAVKL